MEKLTNNPPPKNSRQAILAGIEKGEKAIKEGKVCTHAQAKEKLKKWLNISSAN